jgi:GNAT superfamily N-acetyltransferase
MSETTLTIRRPVLADWPRVLEILETANFHRIGGLEMPAFPLSDCFVAVIDGTVVGVAGYRILDKVAAKTTLLTVDPLYRGNGIGSKLQQERMRFLREQGIKVLYTNCDDPDVIEWNIRHFGFRDTGERIPKVEPYGRDDKHEWVHLTAEL